MTSTAAATNLPRRLGRYEIGGVIATPIYEGASTIFIAIARPLKSEGEASPRSSGLLALSISPAKPHEATKTVQRPVAIKRIASALTKDAVLLSPFIEAARVATTIRHANVAEVDEVGTDNGEVFLVMDYLMGETAASLMRRLHSQGERLKPTLAAYIIAEACAGVEAAHALGVLHGFLTPHDIFIGYNGAIHVLDLGIVAARRKLAGGTIAGVELEYASPEQCRQETLDRRTDVFSLGTMLWELLTGLSPFERAGDAKTIQAVCDETVVEPKKVVPGLPKELSAITMQALARDRGARYQTAQAFRTSLVDLVKKHVGGSSEDELSQLMKRVFAQREKDKREMLGRVERSAPLDGLDIQAADQSSAPARARPPPAQPTPQAIPRPSKAASATMEVDDATDVIAVSASTTPARSNAPVEQKDQPSIIIGPTAGVPLSVGALIPSTPPPPPEPGPVPEPQPGPVAFHALEPLDEEPVAAIPKSGAPARTILVGAVALVAIVGAIVFGLGRRGHAVTSSAKDAGPSTSFAVRQDPPLVASTAPAASSVEIAEAPPPVVRGEETVLHIDTIPAQASIVIAGVKRGVSPLDLHLPKGEKPLIIEIRRPGFVTLKEEVIPNVNQRLKLTLVAARGPAAPASAPAPYKKFE